MEVALERAYSASRKMYICWVFLRISKSYGWYDFSILYTYAYFVHTVFTFVATRLDARHLQCKSDLIVCDYMTLSVKGWEGGGGGGGGDWEQSFLEKRAV